MSDIARRHYTAARSVSTGVAAALVSLAVVGAPGLMSTASAVGAHDDKSFSFSGSWLSSAGSTKYLGADRYSVTAGSSYSFTFSGTRASVYATKAAHHGIVGISVDGGAETMVDLYAGTRADQVRVFATPELRFGTHKIRVRLTGRKNASARGIVGTADRIDVSGTAPAPAPVPVPSSAAGGTLLWSSSMDGGRDSFAPEKETPGTVGNISFPSPAGANGRVLRIRYPAGSRYGYAAWSRFHKPAGNTSGRSLGMTPQRDVTMSYRMYVPSATSLDVPLKFPGLGGVPDRQNGYYTSTGGSLKPDSWSYRMHTRPGSEYSVGRPYLTAYLYARYANGKTYAQNGTGGYGQNVPLRTSLRGDFSGDKADFIRIPRDRWFTVKIRLKLNTPGVRNGIAEAWVDGVQGMRLTDVEWNGRGYDTLVNQMLLNSFYNANGPGRTGYTDLDDFRISRTG